ncbi:hypothetical protein PC128_g19289 [Phytophthora cactorum]|nr:hypothetical protein PC128_g19289 [Phytophthora cactorum]KAG4057419.1 hypothetical protein PC123_g7570 [Phytophthora cactorum]
MLSALHTYFVMMLEILWSSSVSTSRALGTVGASLQPTETDIARRDDHARANEAHQSHPRNHKVVAYATLHIGKESARRLQIGTRDMTGHPRRNEKEETTGTICQQQHDSVGKGNGDGTGNVAAAVGTTSSENPTDGLTPGAHEGAKGTSNTEPQGSNGITKGDKDGNAETDMDALPMAPPSHTADPREHDLESGEEEQEEGEIESSSVPVPEGTDRVNDRDGWRCSRSPHRSWERRNDVQSHQRQEDYRGGPYEQYYSRGPNRRRSRSRSRPRLHVEDFATWEGGGRGDSWDAKERRYEDYDNDEYGRRMYTGEIGRYSGRDYCGGGYNDHTDDAYLRPY